MKFKLPENWKIFLENEDEKEYMLSLKGSLFEGFKNQRKIYPEAKNIFKAFELTSPNRTKVVILGQDPYHGINQANGLSFSVSENIKIPPSLKNIFKEINTDLGIVNNSNGELSSWANQGILLLNSILTVEDSRPGIHSNLGWEAFTDKVIHKLGEKKDIVFMLWGKYASNKAKFINPDKNLILSSSHPSPLSAYRGFFGSKHFSKCNEYLSSKNKEKINWKIK